VAIRADRNVVQKEAGNKLKYKSLCIEQACYLEYYSKQVTVVVLFLIIFLQNQNRHESKS